MKTNLKKLFMSICTVIFSIVIFTAAIVQIFDIKVKDIFFSPYKPQQPQPQPQPLPPDETSGGGNTTNIFHDNKGIVCTGNNCSPVQNNVNIIYNLYLEGKNFKQHGKPDDALKSYNGIIELSDKTINQLENEKSRHYVRNILAQALMDKGDILITQNKNEEAIAVYENIVSRFDKDNSPAVQELVKKAYDEAINAYNELINQFGKHEVPPDVRNIASRVFFKKGDMLVKQGKFEDAITAYEDFVSRFKNFPDLQERVSLARSSVTRNKLAVASEFSKKASVLGNEEAIAVYEKLVRRFDKDESPEVREKVANALFQMGMLSAKQRKHEQAINYLKDIVSRFGKDDSPWMREHVKLAQELAAQQQEAAARERGSQPLQLQRIDAR